jgi:predicted AAA+ superfamily ATPase
MRRHALKDLKNWYQKKNRKPLIIRGARQVGKSTLVRLFAKENQLDLIEINFEKIKLTSVKKDQLNNLTELNQEIESLFNKNISEQSLIFLMKFKLIPW